MAEPRITKETLRALARLSGLELDDDRLEEILPQVQVNADAIARLDELDLENVEPAVTFQAGAE
jgi:Asp-tRNA(Asn)/Glu-tRNA(Gln) amidotransferase C subunit